MPPVKYPRIGNVGCDWGKDLLKIRKLIPQGTNPVRGKTSQTYRMKSKTGNVCAISKGNYDEKVIDGNFNHFDFFYRLLCWICKHANCYDGTTFCG